MPLSLVGTFGVMYAVGYSLDNLSLMALTIAVGFVVDDAIVMIENIVRYIEEGERPFEAALKGAGQIGFTIISITFSLIAVFIPLLFMGGIIGRLFREFAVVVTVAVVMSAFVSLTLTPVMCALLPQARRATHKRGRLNQMAERRLRRPSVRFYDRGLQLVLRHQFLTLLSTIALIVVTGYLYVIDPQGLLSRAGHRLHLRPGRGAAGHLLRRHGRPRQRARRRSSQQDPACRGVFGFVGATGGNSTENTAPHVHPAEAARRARRLGPADHPAAAAQGGRRSQGAKFFMQAGQDINVGGRLSQTQYQYTLTDTDSRRAQPLGADHRGGDGEAARAAGRRLRPADRRAAHRRSTSTATPPRGSACRSR